jgi:formate-nitrite transporter family protein
METFTAPVVTATDHVLGPADAPVTLVEYGDYECPFCRGAFRDVHRLLDRYPGRIRFVFRNFPIQQVHPHAELAAEAAEAAAAQGKFWEMYELLLQDSAQLDLDSLLGYADRLGLDVARFRNEVQGNVYAEKVADDVRMGISNGVNQTPKFYVNGERIDGKFPMEGLVAAVGEAVTAASPG